MLPKSNLHTHTIYVDGRDTPEEMIRAAVSLGFHTLGFSEHGYAPYDDCSMAPEDEPGYREEILRQRALWKDRIYIGLGYEHDWLHPSDLSLYDYSIESVHYVRAQGGLFCVDRSRACLEAAVRELFSGDPYAMCRAYFRTVCESCQGSAAQVLGHIELVMKFNERRDLFDDDDPRYLKYALEAAECAARSGKLVEINTGAIAKGYRTRPYPGVAMLRRIKDCGGRVILSSDCHNSDFLDCGFPEAASLARACGFETAWMLKGPELVEYAL